MPQFTNPLRLAWLSPLPPDASGIAAYSAELLPRLGAFAIETYTSRNAHDFVWRHRRQPYDLVVYQLGNARWHDYMWAYLANYPGLVVLHDARLHHARARQLLNGKRFNEYRNEFWYDHPDARRDVVEYAVEGLGGSVYYFWRMIASVVRTARGVAVHNVRVAADLREAFPDVRVDAIRMGVPSMPVDPARSAVVRRELRIGDDAVVFAAFGKVTVEKRIPATLRAAAALTAERINIHLLLIGDTGGYPTLEADIAAAGIGGRVSVTGEVPDSDLPAYLGAADVCLCLRWPTAEETSASWLRCLAAARPTVISDLPHLVDIPTIVARGWRPSHAAEPLAIAVDVLEEDDVLRETMRRLATDSSLRGALAASGHTYWDNEHRLEMMAGDYDVLLRDVAARPAPTAPRDLPFHWTDDYSTRAREIAARFGVDVDILRSR